MSSALTIRVDRDVWRTRSLSLWSDALTFVIFLHSGTRFLLAVTCTFDELIVGVRRQLRQPPCHQLRGLRRRRGSRGRWRYHQRHWCPTLPCRRLLSSLSLFLSVFLSLRQRHNHDSRHIISFSSFFLPSLSSFILILYSLYYNNNIINKEYVDICKLKAIIRINNKTLINLTYYTSLTIRDKRCL